MEEAACAVQKWVVLNGVAKLGSGWRFGLGFVSLDVAFQPKVASTNTKLSVLPHKSLLERKFERT